MEVLGSIPHGGIMIVQLEMTCVYHAMWFPITLTLRRDDFEKLYWEISDLSGFYKMKKLLVFGEIRYIAGNCIVFDEKDFDYISTHCVGMT